MLVGLSIIPVNMMVYRKRFVSKQFTQFSKGIINSTPGTDIEEWGTCCNRFELLNV